MNSKRLRNEVARGLSGPASTSRVGLRSDKNKKKEEKQAEAQTGSLEKHSEEDASLTSQESKDNVDPGTGTGTSTPVLGGETKDSGLDGSPPVSDSVNTEQEVSLESDLSKHGPTEEVITVVEGDNLPKMADGGTQESGAKSRQDYDDYITKAELKNMMSELFDMMTKQMAEEMEKRRDNLSDSNANSDAGDEPKTPEQLLQGLQDQWNQRFNEFTARLIGDVIRDGVHLVTIKGEILNLIEIYAQAQEITQHNELPEITVSKMFDDLMTIKGTAITKVFNFLSDKNYGEEERDRTIGKFIEMFPIIEQEPAAQSLGRARRSVGRDKAVNDIFRLPSSVTMRNKPSSSRAPSREDNNPRRSTLNSEWYSTEDPSQPGYVPRRSTLFSSGSPTHPGNLQGTYSSQGTRTQQGGPWQNVGQPPGAQGGGPNAVGGLMQSGGQPPGAGLSTGGGYGSSTPPGGGAGSNPPPGGGASWNPPPGGGASWNPPPGGGASWNPPPGGGAGWNSPPGGGAGSNPPPGGGLGQVPSGASRQGSALYNFPPPGYPQLGGQFKRINTPKIELPSFKGTDPLEFARFIALFNPTVHWNNQLDNAEKFIHLLNCLKTSEAKAPINAIQPLPDNYQLAYDKLYNWFADEEVASNLLMDALQQLSMDERKPDSVIKFYNELDSNIRCLNSLNMNTVQLGVFLLPKIERNMGEGRMIEEWSRKKEEAKAKGKVLTLADMQHFLAGKAREKYHMKVREKARAKERTEQVREKVKPKRTTAVVNFKTGVKEYTPRKKCIVCGLSHGKVEDLRTCKVFMQLQPQARFAIAKNERFCFKCLCNTPHKYKECEKAPCEKCKKTSHDVLLCFHKEGQNIKTFATEAEPCEDPYDPYTYSDDDEEEEPEDECEFEDETVPDEYPKEGEPEGNDPPDQVQPVSVNHIRTSKSVDVLMQTLKCSVGNYNDPSRTATLRVSLDSMSERSFITKRAADLLQLEGPTEWLNIITASGETGPQGHTRTKFFIQGLTPKTRDFQVNVEGFVINHLTKIHSRLAEELKPHKLFPQISQEEISPIPELNEEVDVLLGGDYFFDVLGEKAAIRAKKPNEGLVLQASHLGYFLCGKTASTEFKNTAKCFLTSIQAPVTNDVLNRNILRMCEADDIPDMKADKKLTVSELRAEEIFDKTTTYANKQYTVSIPFVENVADIKPNSKKMALDRLSKQEKKLEEDPVLKKLYRQEMNDLIEAPFVREVDQKDVDENKDYYIPHFAIVKLDRSTTQLRVIMDAAAKVRDTSLNDMSDNGPKLQTEQPGIILRSRIKPIMIMADVSKMYHRVLVNPDDRRMMRFFWRDCDPTVAPKVYEWLVLWFGLISAPYLALKVTLVHLMKFQDEFPEAVKKLIIDRFIDDLFTGMKSIQEGIQMVSQMIKIMQEASLFLTKWASNCPEVLEHLPDDLKSKENTVFLNKMEEFGLSATNKILGILWDIKQDVFVFDLRVFLDKWNTSGKDTKRIVVSDASKIFDPLGIITPLTGRNKIFIQDLWLKQYAWDEKLPPDLQKRWNEIHHDLLQMQTVCLKRYVGDVKEDTCKSFSLHVFVDASERLSAAAAYLRTVVQKPNGEEYVTSHLLQSKAKLAPTKRTAIPRLELVAAVKGVLLAEYIKHELDMPDIPTTFHTDSSIVYYWIRSHTSSLQTYVANRVDIIQRHSNADQWHHVRSKDNCADIPSRGNDLLSEEVRNTWLHGPKWLKLDPSEWPKSRINDDTVLKTHTPKTLELRKIRVFLTRGEVTWEEERLGKEHDLFETKRYETWNKTLAVTAQVIKARKLLPELFRAEKNATRAGQTVEPPSLDFCKKEAEKYWLKRIQKRHFREELHLLQNDQPMRNRQMQKLNPQLDEETGLIRAFGRVKDDTIPEERRHPILLPNTNDEPLIQKLVMHYHRKAFCSSQAQTLSDLRGKFWLLNGKVLVKAFSRDCQACKAYFAKKSDPKMGMLPRYRTSCEFAFEVTATDLAGPIRIRSARDASTGEKTLLKVYVIVFTCTATRAVHLDVITRIDAEAVLRALRRFVARRGKPRLMLSDNGRQYKRSAKYLEALQSQDVERYSSEERIEWQFNADRAPHMAGSWERIIGILKAMMNRTMQYQHMDLKEFTDFAIEAEAVMNSRPLMELPDSPEDLVLTPGHFLIGRPLNEPLPQDRQGDAQNSNLRQMWKRQTRKRAEFQKQFQERYVSSLIPMNKWMESKNDQEIKVGTIALLKEDRLMGKEKWPLARVEEVFPGPDGIVRVVKLKCRGVTMKRPVRSLAVLEQTPEAKPAETTTAAVGQSGSGPPKMQAGCTSTVQKSATHADGQQVHTTAKRKANKKPLEKEAPSPKTASQQPVVTRAGRTVKRPSRWT